MSTPLYAVQEVNNYRLMDHDVALVQASPLIELDQLVARVQYAADPSDQAEAFGSLAEVYKPVIRSRVAQALFRSQNSLIAEDVDEVTQETLTRVWLKIHLYEPTAPSENWVATVAHNVAVDYNRHNRLQRLERVDSEVVDKHMEFKSREADTSYPTPEEYVAPTFGEYDHLRHILWAAIPKVNAQYRAALELHLQGMSDVEIAEQLNITHATVRSRLSKARTKLKTLVD